METCCIVKKTWLPHSPDPKIFLFLFEYKELLNNMKKYITIPQSFSTLGWISFHITEMDMQLQEILLIFNTACYN